MYTDINIIFISDFYGTIEEALMQKKSYLETHTEEESSYVKLGNGPFGT